MMNHHELLDEATIALTARLLGETKLFTRSIDAPPLTEAVGEAAIADAERPLSVRAAGKHSVTVDTPVGSFEAAYMPWQWRGPTAPTLLYHHGSGENPLDFGRLASSSFRRLFVDGGSAFPANVVAVRAPFHDLSSMDYARAMGDLSNFVGMVASSVALVDALADRARERTDGPVVAAGLSLGGFVANCHRACHDTLDRYAPMLAGAAFDDLFLASAYRKLVAESARERPAVLRDRLNFEAEYRAVDADDVDPLLARYDRIVEFGRQQRCYEGRTVAVAEKGHTTAALATDILRAHVESAIETAASDRRADRERAHGD